MAKKSHEPHWIIKAIVTALIIAAIFLAITWVTNSFKGDRYDGPNPNNLQNGEFCYNIEDLNIKLDKDSDDNLLLTIDNTQGFINDFLLSIYDEEGNFYYFSNLGSIKIGSNNYKIHNKEVPLNPVLARVNFPSLLERRQICGNSFVEKTFTITTTNFPIFPPKSEPPEEIIKLKDCPATYECCTADNGVYEEKICKEGEFCAGTYCHPIIPEKQECPYKCCPANDENYNVKYCEIENAICEFSDKEGEYDCNIIYSGYELLDCPYSCCPSTSGYKEKECVSPLVCVSTPATGGYGCEEGLL